MPLFEDNVAVTGDTMTGDLTMALDKKVTLSTDNDNSTANRLIGLQFTTESAKAIVAFDDENGDPVAWLQAHKYLDAGLTDLHQHLSLEVSDSSGQLQTRLSIPYGFDTTEIGTYSANFNVNNGHLRVVGDSASNKDLDFGDANSSDLTPDGTNLRWTIRSDTSDDFKVIRRNSSGVAQDNPISIVNSTGVVTLATNVAVSSSAITQDSSGSSAFRTDRGATTNFASFVMTTAGTDQWTLGLRNDSTNDFHFRNNVNSVTPLKITLAATPVLTLDGTVTIADTRNISVGTTTGTKIGTATTQKIGLWNATPIVQPTTGIAEATFVENSGGTAVNVDSTFAGYTLQQITQALKDFGLLA